jgi:ABC-type nitrate/sulfonate/bicarbonate transport system permease component
MTGILLLLWHFASTRLNPIFFPSPAKVLDGAYGLVQEGVLLHHAWASLRRILAGFLIGSAIGIPIGLLMGMYPFARRLFTPYVGFLRFVPPIAMIIFAIVWFGTGETSKIFLVAFSTVFVVVLNVEAGVRSIIPNRIRAALCMGAGPYQLFFYVLLPSCAPFILTGMRIAMGGAFAVIIAAELLSSEEGIGFLLESSRLFMKTDRIFVAIVLLGILGFLTDRCFRLFIRHFGKKYVAT